MENENISHSIASSLRALYTQERYLELAKQWSHIDYRPLFCNKKEKNVSLMRTCLKIKDQQLAAQKLIKGGAMQDVKIVV